MDICRAHEASHNKLQAMSKDAAIDIDRLSQSRTRSNFFQIKKSTDINHKECLRNPVDVQSVDMMNIKA